MPEINPYVEFKQKDKMGYYKYFKDDEDRKRAWKGFKDWLNSRDWFATPEMKVTMLADLAASEYYLPVTDRDLVMKLFEKSVKPKYGGEYFMLIRFSQKPRPLVWSMFSTKTGRLTQVRIGVDQISSTPTVRRHLLYTVVLGQIKYVSETLTGMVEHLRAHYIKETPAYPWTNFFTGQRITVQSASTPYKILVGQHIW